MLPRSPIPISFRPPMSRPPVVSPQTLPANAKGVWIRDGIAGKLLASGADLPMSRADLPRVCAAGPVGD